MSPRLLLSDAETARDVLTFADRAVRAGADGVRLQADAGVLVLTAAILASEGLLDATPTVLGMRIVRADPELRCDLVVATLSPSDDDHTVQLPDTALAPAWAGVSPPRTGWIRTAELSSSRLRDRARWGASAVARDAPDGSAETVVRKVRSRIWREPDEDLLGLPRGIAFAAEVLGFLGDDDEQASVVIAGPWTRLSLQRGHILLRTPATGLTPVRRTG